MGVLLHVRVFGIELVHHLDDLALTDLPEQIIRSLLDIDGAHDHVPF